MPDKRLPGPASRSIGPDRGWVGAQLLILATAVGGGAIEYAVVGRGFMLVSRAGMVITGALALLLALFVLIRAAHDLAGNLTASPTPVQDGALVERGIYGTVRHPMYSGLLAGMLGYTVLLGSWLALALTLALVPFFVAKSRHEERLLRARYPGYDAYARRVRWRFIPRVV